MNPTEPNPLAVYLIHYQRPDWCGASARSILSSDIPVTLTVIDNSSDVQQSLRSALSSDEIRIVSTTQNVGYAGAANVALNDWLADDDDLVVIGSHDLHVGRDTLRRLVDAANTSPDLGVIGPILQDKRSGSSSQAAADNGVADPTNASVVDVEWLSGTCLMIRRRCIEDIGGFDRVYHSYVEDFDLCKRASAAGWRVAICRDAFAWGLGTSDISSQSMSLGMNSIRAHRIHYGTRRALITLLFQSTKFIRNLVGSAAWWRTPDQRRASLRSARAFLAGFALMNRVWAPPDTGLVAEGGRLLHGPPGDPRPADPSDAQR